LGLPANDGTRRAWFSVMTPWDGGIRIDHHSLEYDAGRARRKMVAAGVCPGYASALDTGLWPSLDVLPKAERDAAGTPLDLSEPVIWETPETVD
jgi:hypothetical protein